MIHAIPNSSIQTAGGVNRLTSSLDFIFSLQAREFLGRGALRSLYYGKEVNLSGWTPVMVKSLKPILLRECQLGMLQMLGGFETSYNAIRQPIPFTRLVLPTRINWLPIGLQGVHSKALNRNYNLHNQHVLEAVDRATFLFCQETNATTKDRLDRAIAKLRVKMKKGLSAGDSSKEITQEVVKIFRNPARAKRIAITEIARAINCGQLIGAKESGKVSGMKWQCNVNACDKCLPLDGMIVALGEPFAVVPEHGSYAVKLHPPFHPECGCSQEAVLL